MTTRLGPLAGLGFAHLVSTLVVCGVAALIVPPACAAVVTMDESAIAAASSHTLPGHECAGELLSPDVPDSDDDDGGDDAPVASAIVPSVHAIGRMFDQSWLLHHPAVTWRSSQACEGHALRGPPVSDEDSSDADQNDDDDDDDDDVLRTGHGAAPAHVNRVTTNTNDNRPRYTIPTLDAFLPLSFVFDVQSLRAPPR